MTSRYQRQIVLPEIGSSGQDRLAQSSVLCIGAGGLGSPLLQYLAAAGVGRIGIADDDTVDITNLQRQVLYAESNAGHSKTESAKTRLAALNSSIVIETHTRRLMPENARSLMQDYSIIADASDNFPTKYLIHDTAYALNKPVVSASVLGWKGQISTFNPPHSACYRCLFPEPPQTVVGDCATEGVIGALAGMIGTMQAVEIIKLCLGQPSLRTLEGRLYAVDARDWSMQLLTIHKNANCSLCSKPPTPVANDPAPLPEAHYVDVREQWEWEGGHIENAIHLPLSQIQSSNDWIDRLDKNRRYILYCQHGRRSQTALYLLQSQGFQYVSDFPGGYAKWIKKSA